MTGSHGAAVLAQAGRRTALSDCPCGRSGARGKPLAYDECCGRFIDDFAGTPAPDAESLMRSRYSAFVAGRLDYLRLSWHPSRCPADLQLQPQARWLGLQVRDHVRIDAEHAEVEFVARYRLDGRAVRLHERSRFVREQGRWFYLAGSDLAAGT